MDTIQSLLPSAEKGYLPYFLLVISSAAIGNAMQNLVTLHYTRRIYNGKFVPSTNLPAGTGKHSDPEDSVAKVRPAVASKDDAKARDQVSPLAARLFGLYSVLAGVIRLYAAYDLQSRPLYQLALWTHVLATAHFTSEMLVFKTLIFSWEQLFPLAAAYGGLLWMVVQYGNYVSN